MRNPVKVNGKLFNIVTRSEEENAEFVELVTDAMDKVNLAINQIAYDKRFHINQELIIKLNGIYQEMEDITVSLEARELEIEKPEKTEPKTYYYELMYFNGRKDSGSLYIQTSLKFDGDEDAFLEELIKASIIDASFAEMVMQVDEIDYTTYIQMLREN